MGAHTATGNGLRAGRGGHLRRAGVSAIEQVTLNAGLRYEQFLRRIDANDNGTLNTINQNTGHLFASGGVSYNPVKWFSTSLSYASSVHRPSDDYYVMADMLLGLANMAAKGNPYLKYTYIDIVELKFAEGFGDYYLSQDFSFTYSKDPITFGSRLENDSVWVSFYFLNYFTLSSRVYYMSPYSFSTKEEKYKLYWDASLFYRPTNTLSISLSVQNILDQPIQEYTTKNADLTTYWRLNWFPRTVYLNVYCRIGKDFDSKGGESLRNEEESRRHTSW